ncbi:MAG: HEPN domain-containing protein [Candidatus Peribacteraceae bacterium]|nr:HEPN domain-containing protein [Candidatus Peribacteraceae bacterium]
MTKAETVAHWKRGAHASLKMATLAHKESEYALALFHCHLAVEKALKAVFILEKADNPPPTHDLLALAARLERSWSNQEEEVLAELTEYAVTARYDDISWAKLEATEKNSKFWIGQAKKLLSLLSV